MLGDMDQRTALCVACSTQHPAGTGVCPRCGAPPLQLTGETGYRVVVPEIPSLKQRGELAQRLSELLDPSADVEAATNALGRGESVLCDGLSRESALALSEHLKKLHVSARVESAAGGAAASSPANLKTIVGVALIAVAVLLFLVTDGLVRWAGGAAALVAGLFALALHALGQPRRSGTLFVAPPPSTTLPGWESLPPVLARLLVTLGSPAREALSAAATDVAWLQHELRSGSMASYAAGGPGSPLDQAAQRLLTAAVARGRQLAEGAGDGDELTAGLQTLAGTAKKARTELTALGAAAGTGGELPPGQDVKQLTAGIEQELRHASDALAVIQER
jgi:hypothetical protein